MHAAEGTHNIIIAKFSHTHTAVYSESNTTTIISTQMNDDQIIKFIVERTVAFLITFLVIPLIFCLLAVVCTKK